METNARSTIRWNGQFFEIQKNQRQIKNAGKQTIKNNKNQ